jgi:hypothetical protein
MLPQRNRIIHFSFPDMAATLLGKLRISNIRTYLVWGVVLVYLCQALMPVGYMPDMAALHKGLLRITICSGYGRTTIALDSAAQPSKKSEAPAKHKQSLDTACAFSFLPQADAPPLFFAAFIAGFVFAKQIVGYRLIALAKPLRLTAQPRAPPIL